MMTLLRLGTGVSVIQITRLWISPDSRKDFPKFCFIYPPGVWYKSFDGDFRSRDNRCDKPMRNDVALEPPRGIDLSLSAMTDVRIEPAGVLFCAVTDGQDD